MPSQLSYPGVYVEEVPSGVRTIAGVSTSLTAFIGRARSGPVDEPVLIHGFNQFERIFGGLWALSPMSFAVQQYFANGGADALIVRAFNGNAAAILAATALFEPGALNLRAASPGTWASVLRIREVSSAYSSRLRRPRISSNRKKMRNVLSASVSQ